MAFNCLDCKKEIDKDGRSTRCPQCSAIYLGAKRRGKNHWNYKDGRNKDKNYKQEYLNNYYVQHKEEYKIKAHISYLKNKEVIISRVSQYAKAHKKERNIQFNIYRNKRFQTDIAYKILYRLRGRIWEALKGKKKSSNTEVLLGCSIEFFKTWLSMQFVEGMTFENYGQWHIDHIRPCASFDLSLKEHQEACFNFTNLQPLWAKDNLKKGAKRG